MNTQISQSLIDDYLRQTMEEVREFRRLWVVSQETQDTTTQLSHLIGLPPIVTYEGIVLLNQSPLRTFEIGQVGESEKLFYQIHSQIEFLLYPVIRDLLYALAQESEISVLEALQNMAQTLLKTLSSFRELYQSLSTSDFNIEEGGIPYPGASGASSASIPTLDILFGIDRVEPPSLLTHKVRPMLTGRWYTTLSDMQWATSIIQERWNIQERYSHHELILKQVQLCANRILLFRRSHEGNIKKHLPQVYSGSSGTGGSSNVPEYIKRTIECTKKVIT
jgi:hypothetical protein